MKFPLARLAGAVAAAIALSGGVSWGGDFYFPRFDTNSDLKLLGYTAVHDSKLRLSPSIPGAGIGGAWLPEKQPVKDGFQTTFQIQITEKHNGADGLAFVIQNSATPVLGDGGGNLCYGGISNQLVVHFDNYHWQPDVTLHYDEIAVQTGATPATPLYNVPTNSLATVTRGIVYSDGNVHTVKISYAPGTLQVFLDDLNNPIMTVHVNLAKVMDLDNGRAWVGFTAASGAEWQNHDLVSWKFASSGSVNDLFRSPADAPVVPNVPIYLGTNITTASSQAATLPADRNFGYALPGDVRLSKRIMVSTNLMQWETLTNASYYFRDGDSTNYPRRFYRFETD